MKLITIILLFISTLGLSQTIDSDSIKSDIIESFFNHLDSIGVERPVYIPCISEAATNQVIYMDRNKFTGHRQTLDGIGDTIIPTTFNRVYEFCDVSYDGDGEICQLSVYADTLDLIENIGSAVLNQFLDSPKHKKCLETYHDFYGLDIIIKKVEDQITVRLCIVYGRNLELYNPRFPKTFSINVEAEAKYRELRSNTVIR